MKIKSIDIVGIGGLKKLQLNFNDGMNFICGTNGVGKTTILDCISNFFICNKSALRRNALTEKGECKAIFDDIGQQLYDLNCFTPEEEKSMFLRNKAQKILYFKAFRQIGYVSLNAVGKDCSRKDDDNYKIAFDGVSNYDLKGWFINRHLYLPHDILTEEQKQNFYLAKTCFNMFDSKIGFENVKPDTHDILLSTDRGTIYFEYLSAGYKSCIYICMGIIKEIEFRFKNPTINAADYDGIILIDEIDLHLHPLWQTALVNGLKKLFPKAQIIATTHSPSIIQSANAKEIIALDLNDKGDVYVRELEIGEYGFQGWTLEEILEDVMGFKNVTSKLYNDTIRKFELALDKDDAKMANESYAILEKMLHPRNPLRKILEIQKAGLSE